MKHILSGIDSFCMQYADVGKRRFALVTNDAATNTNGVLSRFALVKAGFNIVVLFSPEHGISAEGHDGAPQHNQIDALTQLPVISLYGDHLMPSEAHLQDVDAVLFDIPDVGCRFYTYLWTMTYVMEACAKFNKTFIVLDRPNPIAGNLQQWEGPMLDEANCASFIGRWDIPLRHCCTLGELAGFFAATRNLQLELQIVKVTHWNRNEDAATAGWQFVATSPAIQNMETALLYPGMGLLEGIHVNEGRGTEQPFKMMGAPWINNQQLHDSFAALHLPGVTSSPCEYMPGWGLYAGEVCRGLRLTVTSQQLFTPVKTGIALLQLVKLLFPQDCRERLYPTAANPSGKGHLDKLTGVFQSFEKLKNGKLLPYERGQTDWQNIIQPWLLY